MDPETVREQIERLERKVDTLRWMQVVQTMALLTLAGIYLLKMAPTLILLAIILVGGIFFFRNYLPGAARWSGRTVSSILRTWSQN